MIIQVKNIMIKSRNPTEHNIKLENKQGELIQVVGDGYCLIEFQDTISKQIKVDSKKIVKQEKLQWYVSEVDFFMPQMVTKHE